MLSLFRDVGVMESELEFAEHCPAAEAVRAHAEAAAAEMGCDWRFHRCYVMWNDAKFIVVFHAGAAGAPEGVLSIQVEALRKGEWDIFTVRRKLPPLCKSA